MSYENFTKFDDLFMANKRQDTQATLAPGAYELKYNPDMDQVFFKEIDIHHDEIVDLPSKEFQLATTQIKGFTDPKTRKAFDKYGFLYKRSFLFHGLHGTGKTILVDRIAEHMIQENAIVLFNPSPAYLAKGFEALTDIQPNTPVVVIFEELDQLMDRFEDDLLHLLDGEIQRDNVVYIATTNFIKNVPARILRPGRFSTVIEVKFPDVKARTAYLKAKLKLNANNVQLKTWVKKTKGLSIDEIKETVLSVKCLGCDLDEVINRINETKKLCKHDRIWDGGSAS